MGECSLVKDAALVRVRVVFAILVQPPAVAETLRGNAGVRVVLQ
jgi:hypothetical protein